MGGPRPAAMHSRSVAGPGPAPHPTLLPVDSTVAGRVHQHGQVVVQPGPETGVTVWLPLHDGATRIGVLSVHVADPDDVATPQTRLSVSLGRARVPRRPASWPCAPATATASSSRRGQRRSGWPRRSSGACCPR